MSLSLSLNLTLTLTLSLTLAGQGGVQVLRRAGSRSQELSDRRDESAAAATYVTVLQPCDRAATLCDRVTRCDRGCNLCDRGCNPM